MNQIVSTFVRKLYCFILFSNSLQNEKKIKEKRPLMELCDLKEKVVFMKLQCRRQFDDRYILFVNIGVNNLRQLVSQQSYLKHK